MIRTFFRHILESLKSLRRNGWMTISSISAVTITLTLLGVFLVVIMNTVKLAQDMENNVDVSVFITYGTDEEGKKELEKELKAIPHVESVSYSSQDEQLERIKESFGDVWGLFDQDNPLLDVYVVSATEPQYVKGITKEAEKLTKYVDKASYGEDISDKIFGIAQGVRTWGLVGSALLLLVAMFLISNTIRITILSREREIQIMRLVGAKNGYIRWPFFLEGGWIGLLGAVIPVALMFFGYQEFYRIANPILLRSNYSLLAPGLFSIQICVLLAIIGMAIGSLGSVISMRRFLKI
ncbi:ABC transporter permease [Enterococcus saccharolyticus]|uniref:Cell division protein FtsX n=1 Tax=Candidatus Enterococcus willemsii TaxID=1857215 RepID=A0ABQ6Z240_9ENTE|nr:permease-like cell division protein FtsX [Enterococcus saccharolyticus]KAF1305493.1 cell division protein FtsX [Enterococcus sp. CU12B]MCD5002749.1 ABC transporter permease [Enterococcus saccharolyticus]